MTSILHVTAHMGGGVGRVIRNLIDCSCNEGVFEHQVNCLEEANTTTIDWAKASGIVLQDTMAHKKKLLGENLRRADIVHLHWWNHPLTYSLLADAHLPKMRVVIWSHVNGHQAPHIITPQLVAWPDIFAVATPYSMRNPCIASMSESRLKRKMRIVQSCAGVEHIRKIKTSPHTHFNIGYVGTVDYCKLHSRFAEMCLKADIPKVRYIVCGEDNGGEVAREVSMRKGVNKFEFRGWVDDISAALSEFDLLGYPLDEHHYGTGEQVLIEAMAAGVPPVVLDNGVERYIVKDGETGIVANSIEEYINALEYLYRHPKKRAAMAIQARKNTLERFGIRRTTKEWHDIYAQMVKSKKSSHPPCESIRDENVHDRPCRLFIQSLGDTETAKLYSDIVSSNFRQPSKQIRTKLQNLKPIFYSQTRGTAFHYRKFFPDSDGLNHLCKIMQNNSTPGAGSNNAR